MMPMVRKRDCHLIDVRDLSTQSHCSGGGLNVNFLSAEFGGDDDSSS